jgi:ubiquinol-cytochrome c reductase cytochrome b subunit
MVKFVQKDVRGFSAEQNAMLQKVIITLSAEAQLKSQLAADQSDAALIEQGRALIQNQTDIRCAECHQFHKQDEDATAPNLTGYGSRKWLISFINNPAHPNFYGDRNDRMPVFGEQLNEQDIGLIADWLRGSWYEPANGHE